MNFSSMPLPQKLTLQKAKCPHCDGDHKRWDWAAGGPGVPGYVDCVCKAESEKEAFLQAFFATSFQPYTSSKFESLTPLDRSLLITGPLDNTWALLRGELEPLYKTLRVKMIKSRDITAAYVQGEDSIEWQDLMEPYLVVVLLTTITESKKMNQIFRSFYEGRSCGKLPTWFVASALDQDFEDCYDNQTMSMLHRLTKVNILEYPATSRSPEEPSRVMGSTGSAAVLPTNMGAPRAPKPTAKKVEQPRPVPAAPTTSNCFKVTPKVTETEDTYIEEEVFSKKPRGRPVGSKDNGPRKSRGAKKTKTSRFDE